MIAEDIIAKIKFVNSEMRIFVDWREDLILEQAEASKSRYEKGKPLSAFDGVPIVIKDQLDVKGSWDFKAFFNKKLHLKPVEFSTPKGSDYALWDGNRG